MTSRVSFPEGSRAWWTSLPTKLTLITIAVVVAMGTAYGILSFRMVWEAQEKHMELSTLALARELRAALVPAAARGDLDTLRAGVLNVVGAREHILEINIVLRDAQGTRLAVTTTEKPAFLDMDRVQQTIAEGTTYLRLREINGERVWDILVPLEVEGRIVGAMEVTRSLGEFETLYAREGREAVLVLGIMIIALAGLLALVIRRVVARPLAQIVAGIRAVEAGNYAARVDLTSRDELGELADAFNRMVKRIAGLLEETRHFNVVLQEEVAAATRQLAEQNERLREVSDALFQTQRRLGHTERLALAGRLAASLAHQVATPLNFVSGHLQLFRQEQPLDAVWTERVREMERQIDAVVGIIQNLLVSARAPEPVMAPLDPNALLEGLLALVAPLASEHRVRLQKDLTPLPPVRGDAGLLEQVLLNLLTNAFDAMPEGGNLLVSTRVLRLPGNGGRDWVQVELADTGCGIPEEDLARIFDPFFTTKAAGEGTGLGLFICREVLARHGGTIELASTLGAGTKALVRLPAAEEASRP